MAYEFHCYVKTWLFIFFRFFRNSIPSVSKTSLIWKFWGLLLFVLTLIWCYISCTMNTSRHLAIGTGKNCLYYAETFDWFLKTFGGRSSALTGCLKDKMALDIPMYHLILKDVWQGLWWSMGKREIINVFVLWPCFSCLRKGDGGGLKGNVLFFLGYTLCITLCMKGAV